MSLRNCSTPHESTDAQKARLKYETMDSVEGKLRSDWQDQFHIFDFRFRISDEHSGLSYESEESRICRSFTATM